MCALATINNLIAVLWHDRRDGYIMSSLYNTLAQTVMNRPKGSCHKAPIPCPTAIVDYNQFMGGVDLAGQHLSYY